MCVCVLCEEMIGGPQSPLPFSLFLPCGSNNTSVGHLQPVLDGQRDLDHEPQGRGRVAGEAVLQDLSVGCGVCVRREDGSCAGGGVRM